MKEKNENASNSNASDDYNTMKRNEEGIAWHNNSKPINEEKVQLDTADVAGEDASYCGVMADGTALC